MAIDGARQEGLVEFYSDEIVDRAARPLSDQRTRRLAAFVARCIDSRIHSVLEIGAGAGRDGQVIAEQLAYVGVDVTLAAVERCRALGLEAVVASATDLPFEDAAFDACWTMSTLMHLSEAELHLALAEIHRVVRPGGLAQVGVWGHPSGLERTDEHGRYFRQLSDDDLVASLHRIGDVVAFESWGPDSGRYQWARIIR